jgi:three-Cys-motif partner protein
VAEKAYQWADGAVLEEHSRRKHRVLREYFAEYLRVRWRLPQQSRFRFAIVEGFAGGGRYKCGRPGSPIIFLEVLRATLEEVNLYRASQGFGPMEVECFLVLNDGSRDTLEVLKANLAPMLAAYRSEVPNLHLRVEYMNDLFEAAYPAIKARLAEGKFANAIYNLDQCGHSHVDLHTIIDIMRSQRSVEIFYTFAIGSLIAFLQKTDPEALAGQLQHLGVTSTDLHALNGVMSKNEWLGAAERLVFETLGQCAPYVSPFSINNPGGWRYWLVHFANSYRARQVYNNILHQNASTQAHFGRSGLDMLSYDPSEEGALYLFDQIGRATAHGQLVDDIPRLVSAAGDALEVADFYQGIYNRTPAHTDDIHQAVIDNPDLEVITPSGGARRRANTISVQDTIKLKRQTSFFPLFPTTRLPGHGDS